MFFLERSIKRLLVGVVLLVSFGSMGVAQRQIVGSWSDTGDMTEGAQLCSILPTREFLAFEAKRDAPPRLVSQARWKLEADVLTVYENVFEPWFATYGIPNADTFELKIVSLGLNELRVKSPLAPEETLVWRRIDFSPPRIPADTTIKEYYETLDGSFLFVIAPARHEGVPGEKIPVRLRVTNTGTEAFFVPLRLADRFTLYHALASDLLIIDPPSEPPQLRCVSLAPGRTVSSEMHFTVPETPGEYKLTSGFRDDEVLFRVLPHKK